MLMVAVRSCYEFILSTISNIGGSHISEKWLSLCGLVLEQCWSLWDAAEQTKRAKAIEEDSLYCYRTKTHIVSDDDEGVEEGAVRQMFPVYDCEFESGKEERGIETKEESEPGEVGDVVCQLSSEEMEEVSSLHQLLFTRRESSQQSSTFLSSKYSLAASLTDIISCIPGDTISERGDMTNVNVHMYNTCVQVCQLTTVYLVGMHKCARCYSPSTLNYHLGEGEFLQIYTYYSSYTWQLDQLPFMRTP